MGKLKIDKSGSIQIYEGRWYRAGFKSPEVTECCSCGLVHVTEYKLEGTMLFWRTKTDASATKAARKREGVKMVATPKR